MTQPDELVLSGGFDTHHVPPRYRRKRHIGERYRRIRDTSAHLTWYFLDKRSPPCLGTKIEYGLQRRCERENTGVSAKTNARGTSAMIQRGPLPFHIRCE